MWTCVLTRARAQRNSERTNVHDTIINEQISDHWALGKENRVFPRRFLRAASGALPTVSNVSLDRMLVCDNVDGAAHQTVSLFLARSSPADRLLTNHPIETSESDREREQEKAALRSTAPPRFRLLFFLTHQPGLLFCAHNFHRRSHTRRRTRARREDQLFLPECWTE